MVIGGTTTAAVGAVKVIKFLRGRPKAVEELAPGEFRLTSVDDRSITVDRSTHVLLQNSSIVNNIVKVYSDPLAEQPNIEDVKTYLKGDETTVVKVDRSDVSALREYVAPSTVPDALKETVKETTHSGVFLNPKRGAFGDDPKDWSFYRGDEVIVATIRDKKFLSECAEGIVRLNQSDLLTVDLLERQKVRGTQVQKPTYEILKVTHYEKGSTASLF